MTDIPTSESITASWLTDVLRSAGHRDARVGSFQRTQIGTGQIGKCIRFALAYETDDPTAPRSVVGKFPSDDPISRALLHTVTTWDIPHEHFHAFVAAMRADLTVTEFATYPELEQYMYGAAAVIGLGARTRRMPPFVAGLLAAHAVTFTGGVLQVALVSGNGLRAAATVGFIPFIPGIR